MWIQRVLLAAVVVILAVASVRGQSTISGYVTGLVTDPSKAVVIGAKVSLENPETSFRQEGATNGEGIFHFDYIPPGSYALTVSAKGFDSWRETIVVTVGQSTTVSAQLKVGSPEVVVNVSAEACSEPQP